MCPKYELGKHIDSVVPEEDESKEMTSANKELIAVDMGEGYESSVPRARSDDSQAEMPQVLIVDD